MVLDASVCSHENTPSDCRRMIHVPVRGSHQNCVRLKSHVTSNLIHCSIHFKRIHEITTRTTKPLKTAVSASVIFPYCRMGSIQFVALIQKKKKKNASSILKLSTNHSNVVKLNRFACISFAYLNGRISSACVASSSTIWFQLIFK